MAQEAATDESRGAPVTSGVRAGGGVGLARLSGLDAAGWFILAWVAWSVLARILVSPNLNPDEAEMALFSQRWAWAYDEQPPLFAWAVGAIFAITGPQLTVLAVLKFAVLGAAAWVWMRAVGAIVAAPTLGRVALALAVLTPLAVDVTRDTTHTPLLLLATGALVWAGWRVAQAGRLLDAIGFSVACALALYAKFSSVFVIVAVILAALVIRPRWRTAGLLLAGPVLGGLAIAPVGLFMLSAPDVTQTGRELFTKDMLGDGGVWDNLARGLADFAISTLSVTLVAGVALGLALLFGRRGAGRVAPQAIGARYLWTVAAAAWATALLSVLLSGTSTVRDLWLAPLYLLASGGVAAVVGPRLSARGRRGVMIAGGVVVALIGVLVPASVALGPAIGSPTKRNIPHEAFAQALVARGLVAPEGAGAVIMVDRSLLGGNLRLHLPKAEVRLPVQHGAPVEGRNAAGDRALDANLIVWGGRRSGGAPVLVSDLGARWGLSASETAAVLAAATVITLPTQPSGGRPVSFFVLSPEAFAR